MSQLITKTEIIAQKPKSIRADKVEPGQVVRDQEGHLLVGLAWDVKDEFRASNFIWDDGLVTTADGTPFIILLGYLDGINETGNLRCLSKAEKVYPVESARLYIKEK